MCPLVSCNWGRSSLQPTCLRPPSPFLHPRAPLPAARHAAGEAAQRAEELAGAARERAGEAAEAAKEKVGPRLGWWMSWIPVLLPGWGWPAGGCSCAHTPEHLAKAHPSSTHLSNAPQPIDASQRGCVPTRVSSAVEYLKEHVPAPTSPPSPPTPTPHPLLALSLLSGLLCCGVPEGACAQGACGAHR